MHASYVGNKVAHGAHTYLFKQESPWITTGVGNAGGIRCAADEQTVTRIRRRKRAGIENTEQVPAIILR